MQLREERLQATKESVKTGEVGLHKEVVTEQQSIDVPHEEVYIERRAGSGQVFDQPRGQDGESIRVPMSAEQVRDCLAGTGDQTGQR